MSSKNGDEKISGHQLKSGVAAWLGWMFDGLDMHLYTRVALPFVAELMGLTPDSGEVREKAGFIQGAFLVGWALGGGLFGLVGDRLGGVSGGVAVGVSVGAGVAMAADGLALG